MNHIVLSGHLTDKVRVSYSQEGKISAFGKIGVYNGKTKEGQQRDSMFFDLVAFGRSAEILRDNTDKGSPVIASGCLEEDTTVSQTNGQTYVNKRIVCDDVMVAIKPVQNQQAQQAPQVPVQTVQQYPQQAPQYAQYPQQAPQYNYPTGQAPQYTSVDPFQQ